MTTSRLSPVLQQDTNLLGQELTSTSYVLLTPPACKAVTISVLSNLHVTFPSSAISLNKSWDMSKPSPNPRLRGHTHRHPSTAPLLLEDCKKLPAPGQPRRQVLLTLQQGEESFGSASVMVPAAISQACATK